MNIHEQQFLTVLTAALQGAAIDPNDLYEADWTALLQLARIHRVLPLFCQAVRPAPEPVKAMHGILRQQVARQAQRTHAFSAVYRQLLDAGLRPLVVKGIACRSLYPQPDLRPSSDEDLLLRPEEFAAACQILASLGFTESGSGLEKAFLQPDTGLFLELHGLPFPDREDAFAHWNRQFDGLFSQAAPLPLAEQEIWTPSPDDHMLYLVLHSLKHFLHSGVGIRQVCDICLYARTYAGEIRWESFWQRCRALHAELFAAALLRIGENHLSIHSVEIPFSVDELPLLEDILQAGLYGDATADRKRSSHITLDAAAGKRPSLLRAMFPAPARLESQYPYLRNRPWLLPVAWSQRLWRYALASRRSGLSPTASARIGNMRQPLLRQYGIIGQSEPGGK